MKKEHNFVYLLAAMLFYLLTTPLVDEFWPWPAFKPQGLIFAATLLLAIFGMEGRRPYVLTGAALAAVAFLPTLMSVQPVQSRWDFISFSAFFLFLLMAVAASARQVYISRRIDLNQLMGAVCIYLLLGVIWSMLYALIFTLDPAAFAGVEASMTIEYAHDWLYFSFVTLATLGYGDILPVSSFARTLAYLEAIVGQFYIAILVAGLVGGYLSEQRR